MLYFGQNFLPSSRSTYTVTLSLLSYSTFIGKYLQLGKVMLLFTVYIFSYRLEHTL
jgi:hypothetical protein